MTTPGQHSIKTDASGVSFGDPLADVQSYSVLDPYFFGQGQDFVKEDPEGDHRIRTDASGVRRWCNKAVCSLDADGHPGGLEVCEDGL